MVEDYSYAFSDHLSTKEFKRLSEFIQETIGIKMPSSKKSMVESRLRKRLRSLNLRTFKAYCEYLFSPRGMEDELLQFINAITTNKTEFFRESSHFDYLVQKVLPELITSRGSGVKKKLMIWSAACSKGDEPYTIAMVLHEFTEQYPGLNFQFSILGTDISSQMLDIAKKGIYDHANIEPVPMPFRKKYLLKSKDRSKNLVRIAPFLRDKVKFRWLNLMDDDFKLREAMDIIFCRNVMIYFDKLTQEKIIRQLCKHLIPDGYIFMGHSEVLDCNNLPLVSIGNTVYKKIT